MVRAAHPKQENFDTQNIYNSSKHKCYIGHTDSFTIQFDLQWQQKIKKTESKRLEDY